MAEVLLTVQAERDLEDLYSYIGENHGFEQANSVLDNLEKIILSLEKLPDRGNQPPELERIGVLGYREIHCTPYRIIYEPQGECVYIHAILDARRELQALLADRLLR